MIDGSARESLTSLSNVHWGQPRASAASLNIGWQVGNGYKNTFSFMAHYFSWALVTGSYSRKPLIALLTLPGCSI
jgi:hypothetical protein